MRKYQDLKKGIFTKFWGKYILRMIYNDKIIKYTGLTVFYTYSNSKKYINNNLKTQFRWNFYILHN